MNGATAEPWLNTINAPNNAKTINPIIIIILKPLDNFFDEIFVIQFFLQS